jgi:Na+-driven multidrug efflux pump
MDVSYYEAWQYMPSLIISTVFLSLATFLGSVYLVKKKSILSLVTSMTGAAVNVAITVILLPIFIDRFGVTIAAQGAAIGSIAGYLAVFVIRAINAQRYVRFNTQPLKLIINTVILSVQPTIMIFENNGWIYYQAGLFILIVLINIKPIIDGILPIIKRFASKLSHRTNN